MLVRLLALVVAPGALLACGNSSLYYGDTMTEPEPDTTTEPDVCAQGKRVLTRDVVNARDLGAMPLLTGESTACGALFRGPPLANLTEDGCNRVAALGIRTVIDLRTPEESSAKPDSACVVAGLNLVSAPLPIPYNVSVVDYVADLDATESMAAAFAALGDDAAYPVYFHCTWGRDRTGILAALVYSALEADRENIVAEYNLSAGLVGAYPDSLRGALAEIDARGGIGAYLAEVGVSEAQLAVLRAHAVAAASTD